MIANPHVRSQHVSVSIAKDGTITSTLVVETNLQPQDADFDELVEAVVEYIKTHNGLDRADINTVKAVS